MVFFRKSRKDDIESETKENELSDTISIGSQQPSQDAGSVEQYHTKRELTPRTLHMIAIGGAIGTGLFVTISTALYKGGPGSLFIAYFCWTCVIFAITASVGEFVCYLPISSPFIQMAGRCVDEAFEMVVGFNYYIMISCYIPFEIVAVNGMIHYWRDDYSPAITLCIQIVIYSALNLYAVKWFGESEFYLTITKVLLAFGLMFFTFITMVGGNPQHDAFGFRYWNNPGSFAEFITTGSMGRFHGFLGALIQACFTIVGPEYLSMVAGEAGQETRKVLAGTFRTVFYRLILFYVVGALSVGILLPYNDPTLISLADTGSTSSGAYSPYIIAINNMGIKVLPHIVNAACVITTFSAGNSYVYCSSRALYSISLRGHAPKIFQTCTKQGVPIYCVGMTILFSLLSLLQLSDNTAKVLSWILGICTSSQLNNYFFMCITYIGFYKACNAQGVDRTKFTYRSWFQPYTAYFGMFFTGCMICCIGYTVFMPGNWDTVSFLTSYLMLFLDIALFIGYKLIMRTKFVKPEEADLITGLDEVEQHEMNYLAQLQREGKSDTSTFKSIMNWVF